MYMYIFVYSCNFVYLLETRPVLIARHESKTKHTQRRQMRNTKASWRNSIRNAPQPQSPVPSPQLIRPRRPQQMEPHTHTNDVTRHFNGQHTALHRLGMSILATTTTAEQAWVGGPSGVKGGLDVCVCVCVYLVKGWGTLAPPPHTAKF